MILTQLKHYLQAVPSANLLEISQRFAVSTDVARDMLALWIRKGKVIQQERKVHCASPCAKCLPQGLERYQWA